jgi:hypothetical protein
MVSHLDEELPTLTWRLFRSAVSYHLEFKRIGLYGSFPEVHESDPLHVEVNRLRSLSFEAPRFDAARPKMSKQIPLSPETNIGPKTPAAHKWSPNVEPL